jgi:hypothetical protein
MALCHYKHFCSILFEFINILPVIIKKVIFILEHLLCIQIEEGMLGLINRNVYSRVFKRFLARQNFASVQYVQGQLDNSDTGKGAREYFYYIDHQGQVCGIFTGLF